MRSALLTMLGIFVAGGCQGEDAPPVTTEDVKTQTVIIQKAAAGDWPRWRGPHGDGISREVDWSHDWGKDGPKQLWKDQRWSRIQHGFGGRRAALHDGP